MKFNFSKEWFEKTAKLEEECEPGGILACSPEIYKQCRAANDKFVKLSLKEKIEHLDKEIFPDKKTKGPKLGREIRAKCDNLNKKQCQKLHKRGMKLINQDLGAIEGFDTR